MQQGSASRTPCRRLGLSRAAGSKSSPSPLTPRAAGSKSSSSESTPKIPVSPYDENQKPYTTKLLKRPSDDGRYQASLSSSEDEFKLNPKFDSATHRLSPIPPVAKRHCSDDSEMLVLSTPVNVLDPKRGVFSPAECNLHTLRKRVALKEKQMQQLCQTKIYNKKHDPDQLMQLVRKWLRGCQEALQEFLSELNNNGTSINMSELLEQLGIPPSLVNLDVGTNEFFDMNDF